MTSRSGLPAVLALLSTFVVAIAAGMSGCSATPTATTPAAQASSAPAAASAPAATATAPGQTPLVSAQMSLVSASEVPSNPLTDTTLDRAPLGKTIRWGFRLFTDTRGEAPQFVASRVSCTNCHLNAGQRERALPVVAIAGMFPEYNRRAGRVIDLTDRIVDCFFRSENATGRLDKDPAIRARQIAQGALPTKTSPEVIALNAYLTWLSRGTTIGKNPTWRGQNTIPSGARIPLKKLDPAKGAALYAERCVGCHGPEGQGVPVGDRHPGPLWGPDSWNDGAGAARVYTLAGIIRYTMPYVAPGSLTDEQAQQIAAFITSKPRPAYPFKDKDYRIEPLPIDAVYYRQPTGRAN